MSASSAALSGSDIAYTFRPSLLGAPWEFTLTGDAVVWAAGRKSGSLRYGDVRRVRMSYRPVNMASYRFVTELWGSAPPKLQIASISWKSMVLQERLDGPYAAFIAELHKRIAQSGAQVTFEQGSNRLVYGLGVVVLAGVTLALCALIVRALQTDAKGGAVFVAIFMALFVWRGGEFLRRNRPAIYSPDALPAQLMPR